MKGKTKGVKSSPEFYTLFYLGFTPKDLRKITDKTPALISYYYRKYLREVKPAIDKFVKPKPASELIESLEPNHQEFL